jgi:hypothetical protein
MRRVPFLILPLLPTLLLGQGSPYLPLDDPRLPAFELLVARGEVHDPAAMVRPFRRIDALEVLARADTSGAASRRLIQELRAAWVQDTATAYGSLEVRAGADAYTDGRRDPLHPDDQGNATFYGEVRGEGRFGPLIFVSRSAVEPRLNDDPDWRGRTDLVLVGRMAEAYLSGQWKYGRLFYGTIDRQWGPSGVPGIPLSNYAYPRTELAVDIGNDRLRLSSHAAALTDVQDTNGVRTHRYWFAHRLAISPSRRLAVALWETTVISGVDRNFDARWRNPAAVLLLSDQYGLGADGNIMVGADLTWWAKPKLRLEGQFALDDLNYPDPHSSDKTPSRYAFTLAASGPFARSAAWKVLYTEASSLAFRTFDPAEAYVDAGVGLGRGYASNDQLSLFLTQPVTNNWMVTPELTLLRQGDAQITDSFPRAQAAAGNVPTLLIGTVERTWRAALGVTGAYGPFQGAANIGVHYVQNVDHQMGKTEVEPVARIRFTLGLGTGGPLQ